MALAYMGLNSLLSHAAQGSTRPVRVRSDRKYPRSERKLNPEWLNSYWQTDLPYLTTTKDWKFYLKERGYYYKPYESLSRLKELAKRCARGLQSYDAHDVKTLRALALSRGGGRVQLRFKKQELVRFLETADDWEEASRASPTFHRFSELPPELRNRVYTFYFQSLGKVPPRFAVPPLCRTSRQLQLETTGLFFEQSTFIISMRRIYCRQPYAHKAQLHYHSEVAKSNIPMPNFAQIKHLHVELKACSNGSPSAVWTIDLTEAGAPANGNLAANITKKASRLWLIRSWPVKDWQRWRKVTLTSLRPPLPKITIACAPEEYLVASITILVYIVISWRQVTWSLGANVCEFLAYWSAHTAMQTYWKHQNRV